MINFVKSGPNDQELQPRRIPFILAPDGTVESTPRRRRVEDTTARTRPNSAVLSLLGVLTVVC